MSEAIAVTTKPMPARSAVSDSHMLAEVEKWLAMIREINRERDPKFRG